MTWILGISAFFHDSSVALLRDGHVIFAASEERFSRVKHDAGFPAQALRAALTFAGISAADLDYVGFYEKPLRKLDRLLETYLSFAPRGYVSFARAMPGWLHTKLHLRRELRQQLGDGYRKRFVFCEHHEAHAASAFFPSPFEEAAILTVDGVGEWATTCWGVGRGNHVELKQEIRFPHSLGLLYSAMTYFCGFRVNSGEYKLMGLTPYGEPRFSDLLTDKLIEVRADGSFQLDMRYFGYCHTLRMTTKRLERLLGVPRRRPEGAIRQVDMDLAASVQRVTEMILLRVAEKIHAHTGLENLCLAGGVALNCVANGRLLRQGPFRRLWIQPAAGDDGGALGVAWLIWHQLLQQSRVPVASDAQQGSLLGTDDADEASVESLLATGAVARKLESDDALDSAVAELLAQGNVVGWIQGRMEFGPRALGNRSILADPRQPGMQAKLNLKIKSRESFRPFAPAVLQEWASQYFEMQPGLESPYMLMTFPVRNHLRRATGQDELSGLARVNQQRSELPAITHLDYSARVQTVAPHRHPRFHQLLTTFHRQTGCPVLINTSFNVRGEPMVRTAADAYRCFLATEMDALVIGRYLLLRQAQPQAAVTAARKQLAQLELD